jgi:hypothetical protein
MTAAIFNLLSTVSQTDGAVKSKICLMNFEASRLEQVYAPMKPKKSTDIFISRGGNLPERFITIIEKHKRIIDKTCSRCGGKGICRF